MGVFRLLLALSVLFAHSGSFLGLRPLGGLEAVETFFIISGFYMTLILSGKYRGPDARRIFWGNRALRIYPMYWAVAALSALFWIARYVGSNHSGPLQEIHPLRAPGLALVVFSNLFLFGQDVVMFSGADAGGNLHFYPDFQSAVIQLWHFLLIPQAWTLAVELTFYLVAPFLVLRRTSTILAIMAASFALRAFLFFHLGLKNDPWTYRFFPTEIAFFLAGALAYRHYVWLRTREIARPWLFLLAGSVFALSFLYEFLPAFFIGGAPIKPWIFFLTAWAGIPTLFLLSKNSRLDRYIGELSYPVYIVHTLVINFVLTFWGRFGLARIAEFSIIALTIVVSLLLIRFVSEPIERIRQARAKSLPNSQTA